MLESKIAIFLHQETQAVQDQEVEATVIFTFCILNKLKERNRRR